jgi:hypothetical protein
VPPTVGTTLFTTTLNGATLLPNLIVEIPFGATTAYTTVVTTPVNNNYAQFVALNTATKLREAQDNTPPVILPSIQLDHGRFESFQVRSLNTEIAVLDLNAKYSTLETILVLGA